MNKLFIELFHFDKNTDYLPYYKKYTLKYDEQTSVNKILDMIEQKEPFGIDKSKTINVKINHLYTNANVKVSELVKILGVDWKIEPISTYRATKDFIYDNSDFLDRISLFDKYLNYSQKQNYKDNYEMFYYASNSINVNRDYIGDHSLYIAYNIIKENPSLKDEILSIITKLDSGISYHTSLENRIFGFSTSNEEKIEFLFKIANLEYKKPTYLNISDIQIIQKFDTFNISAYMPTAQTKTLIQQSGAKYININTAYNDIAICNLKGNKKFSLKLAGEFLLDAMDNNADLVIVDDEFLAIFDGMQCEIENSVGRDIRMPILTKTEFTKILAGNKDAKALGLDKHKVVVSLF
ncbi:hypothetical protein [Arcobacter sp. FWKO B]|uniref:hypothetical protein n=1 Tax=Arcobacter sp. FWKO B TaxID=2593672 RepID=UPI0018A5C716|nr:hypothetical protein [Arcobacter sp. FWKO B]QOG11555.1 hypothetical protein FWKOB_02070 [Arcobacter sp. FWKO B]